MCPQEQRYYFAPMHSILEPYATVSSALQGQWMISFTDLLQDDWMKQKRTAQNSGGKSNEGSFC